MDRHEGTPQVLTLRRRRSDVAVAELSPELANWPTTNEPISVGRTGPVAGVVASRR